MSAMRRRPIWPRGRMTTRQVRIAIRALANGAIRGQRQTPRGTPREVLTWIGLVQDEMEGR